MIIIKNNLFFEYTLKQQILEEIVDIRHLNSMVLYMQQLNRLEIKAQYTTRNI